MTIEPTPPVLLCPRRIESPPHPGLPQTDLWRSDGTCSYCGSLSPAKFFAAVEAGCKIGPTDKSYKVYVDLPHPDPKGMRVYTAIAFDPTPQEVGGARGWEKVTDENRHLLRESGWSGSDCLYMRRCENGPTSQEKFYFQHLSEADKDRFIELHNAGKMNIGYPGRFYVTPFFCTRAVAAPVAAQ